MDTIKKCGVQKLIPPRQIVEEDPWYHASPAATITAQDIERWNSLGGSYWGLTILEQPPRAQKTLRVLLESTLEIQALGLLKLDLVGNRLVLDHSLQTITLSGVVSGSGTSEIITNIADGALTISKVYGLQEALDAKLTTETDPVFGASPAGTITAEMIELWNSPVIDETDLVHKSGAELIWGAKQFTNFVNISTEELETSLQVHSTKASGANSIVSVTAVGGASQTGIRVTLGGTGVGVVTSGGNTGGYFYGSDYGVVGEASSGIAGQFYGATYATDNMVRTSGISGISPITRYSRHNLAGSAVSAGYGLSEEFNLWKTIGTDTAGERRILWTNASLGTETTAFEWWLRNNGNAIAKKMDLHGNGNLTVTGKYYGTGATLTSNFQGTVIDAQNPNIDGIGVSGTGGYIGGLFESSNNSGYDIGVAGLGFYCSALFANKRTDIHNTYVENIILRLNSANMTGGDVPQAGIGTGIKCRLPVLQPWTNSDSKNSDKDAGIVGIFWNSITKDAEDAKLVVSLTKNGVVDQTAFTVYSSGRIKLVSQSSAPTAEEGSIYYNSTTKHFFGYDGTTWKQLDN